MSRFIGLCSVTFLGLVTLVGCGSRETVVRRETVQTVPAPPVVVERQTTVEAVPAPPAVIEKKTTVQSGVIERRTTEIETE